MKKTRSCPGSQSLFAWFNEKIAAAFNVAPTQVPAETLRQLGAPASLTNVFAGLDDCEIGLKQTADGYVPDLELRAKKRRRSTGQFYTPESLANRLVAMANPIDENGNVLDPACGDGSFLLAAAAALSHPLCHWSACSRSGDSPTLSLRAKRSNLSDPVLSLRAKRSNLFLNRIHGYDIDQQALFICLTRLICAYPGCGWPALERRDFLLQPPQARFDLVIGNPPYRVNLSEEYKNRLAELYETSEGEKDLYTFFLEGGLRALVGSGQLIMLTSHTWLVNHQCRKIRQFLFEKNRVERVSLLPARFFATAPGVLPVVAFVAGGQAEQRPYPVEVDSGYSETTGWKHHYSSPSEAFIAGNGLRQSIVTDRLQLAFGQMQTGGVQLGQIARVGVGIQESQKRGDRVSQFVSDKKFSPAHRPVLKGRELAPFKINWESCYIEFGRHLAHAGDEKIWSGAKLLYQNIRNEKLKTRLVVAYDTEGYYPKNSISFIVSESTDYPELFLLGLLNSVAVNAWFSSRFHSFHVTVTQVRQIPLPPVNKALFAAVAEDAAALQSLEAGSTAFVKVFLRLNKTVCDCYGFEGDFSELLREFDNLLEEAASL